jgi:hypothetical protein
VVAEPSSASKLFRRSPLLGHSDRRLAGIAGNCSDLRAGIPDLMKILDQQVDERPYLGRQVLAIGIERQRIFKTMT